MVSILFHLPLFFLQTDKVQNVRRLINGLGSSKSDARTGFYSTLVGLLSTNQADEYPTIANLFEVMDDKLEVTEKRTSIKNVSNFKFLLSFHLI